MMGPSVEDMHVASVGHNVGSEYGYAGRSKKLPAANQQPTSKQPATYAPAQMADAALLDTS